MHFGNPCAISRRPKAVLRATGDDAASFLQGQFSNELRKPVGAATYGLWLDQKGKVLADSTVLRVGENEFVIVSEHGDAALIQQRLEHYLVADDVTLANETDAAEGLVIFGEKSGALLSQILGSVPADGLFVRAADVFAVRGRWWGDENFLIFGTAAAVNSFRDRLAEAGALPGDSAALEFARVDAGIPAVPVDAGPGDLPNEAGLDEGAISYTKGCYLGQEVMARLKNLGQVRRRLQVVSGEGAPPTSRSALYQADKKVGELRSVAGHGQEYRGLAMISLVNFQPGVGLSLEPLGKPVMTVRAHG